MLESLKRGLKQVVADAGVHAAPTIKSFMPLDSADQTRRVGVIVKPNKLLLEVRDSTELLDAREARAVAAALLEAADILDRAGKPAGDRT